ncbi:MAG: GyrI-like domain-containing protein [Flavobacteriaceae bacterium]|nr:GyrI-like domain-containing protein [Flavobacteriaceae bacterium]
MKPSIKNIKGKKLIGKRIKMSLTNNLTHKLWAEFTPRINEIKNNITTELVSMQVYDSLYYENFEPSNEFEKWATVEVTNFDNIPNQMESFTLSGGLYAVFYYKGSSSDISIFQYIFESWLPNSEYELDNRPHFEVLGDKYKSNDPNSEEEIWIPIINL